MKLVKIVGIRVICLIMASLALNFIFWFCQWLTFEKFNILGFYEMPISMIRSSDFFEWGKRSDNFMGGMLLFFLFALPVAISFLFDPLFEE